MSRLQCQNLRLRTQCRSEVRRTEDRRREETQESFTSNVGTVGLGIRHRLTLPHRLGGGGEARIGRVAVDHAAIQEGKVKSEFEV